MDAVLDRSGRAAVQRWSVFLGSMRAYLLR